MKALKLLAIVVALGIAAWSAVALYWRFRIGRALRTMEKTGYFSHATCRFETTPSEFAAQDLLVVAGVRALPALVRSVDPGKPAPYLTEATVLIRKILMWSRKEWSADWKAWVIDVEAEPEEREEQCRLLQEWWSEHGHEFVRPWQPWDRGYHSVR